MDAGIAAVCGAIAGSFGTVAAALATGWAQREGARITARAAHVKDQRQPRYDAYKELLRSGRDLALLPPSGAVDDDMADCATELIGRIDDAGLEVVLLGPASVIDICLKLLSEAHELHHKIKSCAATGNLPGATDETDDPNTPYAHYVRLLDVVDARSHDLSVTLDGFAVLAQRAIGNDGSSD
ncbi:hypothetical protein AB0C11_39630 [Streptomyces sp. NPDC039016]|uniref:hypothetical protein n=1 Tax=Streptomyces sp. NPDC039016 TaxID=3154330 RepID=UPI00340219D3